MSCDVEEEMTFFLCIFHNSMAILEFSNKTDTMERASRLV